MEVKKYKIKEVQLCGICKGEGHKTVITEAPRHGSDTGTIRRELCPTCEGTGMVAITRDITLTIKSHKTS